MVEHEKTVLHEGLAAHLSPASLAMHDDLTALHNRQYFITRLADAHQRRAANPAFGFAVLLLDLDRFKLINDGFGYRAGDLTLVEIAARLRNCTPPGHVVARLGSDEFALLVEGVSEASYVANLAERLVEVVRYPIWLSGKQAFASASIGAAIAGPEHALPEDLLRDADIAMVEAKRRHKGFLTFDSSMHRGAIAASQWRTELQHGLARSEFYLEYQPIFNLVTKEVAGVEALVRWRHPVRGTLMPDSFIGVAEETGLIREIGAQIMRMACRQMQAWQQLYPENGLRMSVNISGHELTDIRFIPQLSDILVETRLNPALLQLEVTESVLVPSSEPIAAVINDAKALGVRFALDDFGTGYSSLGYLDRYPIDAIKIDQSFVAGIPDRQRTLAILKAIIDLARALHLEIIAEGIEVDAQTQGLLAMGCVQAQGFLLSRPISAEAVTAILQDRTAP